VVRNKKHNLFSLHKEIIMNTKKITQKVRIFGVLADGTKANNRQGKDVVYFESADKRYKFALPDFKDRLKPPNGTGAIAWHYKTNETYLFVEGPGVDFPLEKSKRYKQYVGRIGEREVNVVLKKVSGEMRYIEYVPLPGWVIEKMIKNGSYSGDYY
jgi:hypothetical protein